ncbi:MAG: hypothetical protein ACYC99_00705 [Candidatus Geothermincolia bacterium]
MRNANQDQTPSRFKASLMDQAEYLDRIICNQQIQCVLELDGRVDESRLERALRLAMDAEPVLGCRFVEGRLAPHWQRRDDLDQVELFSVEECSDETDLSDRMTRFLLAPGDPRTDPLVRVKVLRSERDTVCVKIDHIAADTGGARDCLHLLCDLYEDIDRAPRRWPANPAVDRGLRQVLGKFTTREKLSALRFGNPSAPAWGFPFGGNGSGDRAFAVRRIPPADFAALKGFGESHGATVNDCLLASYFSALFELADLPQGAKCTIRVPIDLRRYLEGETAGAVCNLTGQMFPALERVRGESFEGTLARARDAMNVLKANLPGIGAAIAVAGLMTPRVHYVSKIYKHMVAHEARTGMCDPYLSNMGVLSPERLRFGDIGVRDAYFVSPLQWAPGFLLGASTFRGTLTLTVGYADARANAPVVESFLDFVEGNLRRKP